MFGSGALLWHYFGQSTIGFRRNWVLTTLIVLALGLGIGASMTMITVMHVMSGDPLPDRSSKLFYPHLQPGPGSFLQSDPGKDFTWLDATNLLRAHRAVRQAIMTGGKVAVRPGRKLKPYFSTGHYVSAEFFSMFGAAFAAGGGWDPQADSDRGNVVVLNGEFADKLFGSATKAVDQTIQLNDHDFRVVGVLNNWHPEPLFYGAASGAWAFKSEDQFFLPFTTAIGLKLPISSGESCWGDGGRFGNQCTWLQFWVELDSNAQVSAYQNFLVDYWQNQKAHGRFPLNIAPELHGLMQRLQTLRLVPPNVSLQLWLAIGFLWVCLFNTVCLMLAKFLRRSGEIGIRRAMGATRRDIFLQLGIEAAVLGLAGGVLGLLFTGFGLWLVRQRPDAYAKLAHLDLPMVLTTVVMAIIASTLSGLLPAWRACRIPPALQLKVC